MVIGLKEMTFVSALADLVIIEEFVSRIIAKYNNIEILDYIDSYFPLFIGIIMAIVSITMLHKFIRYKK